MLRKGAHNEKRAALSEQSDAFSVSWLCGLVSLTTQEGRNFQLVLVKILTKQVTRRLARARRSLDRTHH